MALEAASSRVLVCVCLIALGWVAKRCGWVNAGDGAAVLRVIFGITLPAVLLTTFSSAPLQLPGAGLVVAASVLHALCMTFLSLTWDNPLRPAQQAALLSGASFGVNLGLFAYAFAGAAFGTHGLQVVVLFDLFNQAVLLIFQYLAFWWRCGRQSNGSLRAELQAVATAVCKRLLTPCLLALYAAAALAVTRTSISPAVGAVTNQLVGANAPLTLLALGMVLDIRMPAAYVADVTALLGCRFGVSLAFGAVCVAVMQQYGGVATTTLAALLIAMSAPVPMLTLTYSQEFGCDTSLAAIMINASMVCAFLCLCAIVQLSSTHPTMLAPAAALGATFSLLVGALGRVQQHKHLTRGVPAITAEATPVCGIRMLPAPPTSARSAAKMVAVRYHRRGMPRLRATSSPPRAPSQGNSPREVLRARASAWRPATSLSSVSLAARARPRCLAS